MASLRRLPRQHKPAVVEEAFLVRRPIAPCTLIPAGRPGEVQINGTAYSIEFILAADQTILGFRIVNLTNGQIYDLDAACRVCDCPDYTFRRLQKDARGCKHCIGLRAIRGINS
jgi:hypothetical protein